MQTTRTHSQHEALFLSSFVVFRTPWIDRLRPFDDMKPLGSRSNGHFLSYDPPPLAKFLENGNDTQLIGTAVASSVP